MRRFLFVFILITVFASGCSNSVNKLDTQLNTKAEISISNIQLNPKVKSIISDEPKNYVNNMACTNEDINQILKYAKEYGIENPYIPTEGIATEYIMEVRKEDGALQIVYPHFSIHESSKEIPAYSNDVQTKNANLSIGDAVWRGTGNNLTQLYLHLNNIYIVIDSAKYFDENGYKKIAESMVQIKR